jgi:uncharacterized membrane protein
MALDWDARRVRLNIEVGFRLGLSARPQDLTRAIPIPWSPPMLNSVTKIKTGLRRFAENESGAVTVDWVALTAGIIVVGLAIVWYIMDNGVDVLAGKIVTGLAAIDPSTTTGAPPVIDGAAGG